MYCAFLHLVAVASSLAFLLRLSQRTEKRTCTHDCCPWLDSTDVSSDASIKLILKGFNLRQHILADLELCFEPVPRSTVSGASRYGSRRLSGCRRDCEEGRQQLMHWQFDSVALDGLVDVLLPSRVRATVALRAVPASSVGVESGGTNQRRKQILRDHHAVLKGPKRGHLSSFDEDLDPVQTGAAGHGVDANVRVVEL